MIRISFTHSAICPDSSRTTSPHYLTTLLPTSNSHSDIHFLHVLVQPIDSERSHHTSTALIRDTNREHSSSVDIGDNTIPNGSTLTSLDALLRNQSAS